LLPAVYRERADGPETLEREKKKKNPTIRGRGIFMGLNEEVAR